MWTIPFDLRHCDVFGLQRALQHFRAWKYRVDAEMGQVCVIATIIPPQLTVNNWCSWERRWPRYLGNR